MSPYSTLIIAYSYEPHSDIIYEQSIHNYYDHVVVHTSPAKINFLFDYIVEYQIELLTNDLAKFYL